MISRMLHHHKPASKPTEAASLEATVNGSNVIEWCDYSKIAKSNR